MKKASRDPTPPPRPAVNFAPGLNFGAATIGGVPVYALVEILRAGEPSEIVCDEYSVTRGELVVACWFVAQHGPWRQRRRWRAWLDRYGQTLWRGGFDPAAVPLPTEEGAGD